MKSIKELWAKFKKNKIIKTTCFIFICYLAINIIHSTSSEKKVQTDIRKNKVLSDIQELKSTSELFAKVSIVQYGALDKYYFEFKDGKPALNSEYSAVESKLIQENFIKEMNIPFVTLKASLFDKINFYILNPIISLIKWATSTLLGIVTLIFFGLSLIILKTRIGKGRSKFTVEQPSSIKGSLNDIVGSDDIKQELLQIVDVYKNRESYRAYGITDENFNIMFSGPAGVGKTQIAGFLAKEFNCPIIMAPAAGLETGLVGGGSDTVNSLYKEAQAQVATHKRCIIFIDEAEILFRKRGSSQSSGKHSDDTSNMLLSLLEGISTVGSKEIIWVAASNFNEVSTNMDEAMLRRFPLKLDFRLPNKEERKGIFELYVSKIKSTNIGDVDYEYLAEISTNLSPALIKTIVQRAGIQGAKTNQLVCTTSLYDAFEKTVIGLTNRETTAHANEKRKLIGYHELGHFVVQLNELMDKHGTDWPTIKENMKVLKISTESLQKQGALGYVLSKNEEIGLYTLNDLENHIKQLYGGVVAEKLFFGERNITIGSGNDIEKATSILKNMIFNLGMYSNSKINYQVMNNQGKNDELMSFMEKKSEELFIETEEIMKKHKDLIEYLNPILMEKYVLQADDIIHHLSEFYDKKNC